MQIWRFKSKIHRATVTDANLNYEGSITIDAAILEAANMIEGERVQVVNNNNGERLETYIIAGERHSVSFGVRWHGELPAVLWEVEGPDGLALDAGAADPDFRSTQRAGEALLAGFRP